MREAAGSSCTGHHAGEMLDDDDIFDDDAPLLPDMHIIKTPKIAHDPGVSYNRVLRNSCQVIKAPSDFSNLLQILLKHVQHASCVIHLCVGK